MRIAVMITSLVVASGLLGGCSQTPPSTGQAKEDAVYATPKMRLTFFHSEHYPRYYAAVTESLRDHGFEIERSDYRFGAITTKPKEAPTFFEFWIDDATTAGQARSDTLNAQQRTVKIRVRPMKEFFDSEEFGLTDLDQSKQYGLLVQVFVERTQKPARFLTHSARGRLSAEYTVVPTHLINRGIDGTYAQSMDRDIELEERIESAILAIVSEAKDPSAEQPTE